MSMWRRRHRSCKREYWKKKAPLIAGSFFVLLILFRSAFASLGRDSRGGCLYVVSGDTIKVKRAGRECPPHTCTHPIGAPAPVPGLTCPI
jgi:hypothetical protein